MRVRRGRWPLLLLAAGVAVLAATAVRAPLPMDFESADQDVGPGESRPDARRYVARGPALARYEPDRDETLALFRCSHWYCHHVVVIQGDARAAVEAPRVLLLKDAPLEIEPLPEPFFLGEEMPPGSNVTTRYVGSFRTAPLWPGVAALDAGVALLGGSALVALWPRLLPRIALLGAAPGYATGHLFAVAGGEAPIVFAILILVPAAFLGCGLLALGLKWPRVGRVGAALLSFVVAYVLAASLLRPYFPAPPTL